MGWSQAGSKNVTVSYAFDGNTSFATLSTNASATASYTSAKLDVSSHTTISLKFTRASNTTNVRLDNLVLTATAVSGSTPTTVSAVPNTEAYGSVSVSGNTITATPAEGYRVSTSNPYTVTAGSATVAQDGNEFTVTADADCTIQINFEEIPTYTLTYYTGTTANTKQLAEGAGILDALKGITPTSCDATSTTFMGWTGEPISVKQTNAPDFISDTEVMNSDRQVYAVFATETTSGSGSGEAQLSQTLQYDTWTYSGSTTDKKDYRLFPSGSYIESAEFDLSTLSKVVVYGGTFGGDSYNKLTIGDGTNTWKDVTVSGSSQTGVNTYTNGTSLSGTGKLRITSKSGTASSNGVRISKVEIYTTGPTTTYTDYVTQCVDVECTANTLSLTATETTVNLPETGGVDVNIASFVTNRNNTTDAVTYSGSGVNSSTGAFHADAKGDYVINISQPSGTGDPVICNVNKTFTVHVLATPTLELIVSTPLTEFAATCMKPSDVQQITVHGFNLENKITATVGDKSAFQLSTTGSNNDGDWSTSVDFAKDVNNRVNSTLYIRLKSNLTDCPNSATTTRTGTITANSTNAAPVQQAVSGKISSPGVTVKLNDQGTNYNIAGKRLCCTIAEDEVKRANNGFSTTPCEGALFSHFTLDPNDLEAIVKFPYSITSTDELTFYAVYKKSEDGGPLVTSDTTLITSVSQLVVGEKYIMASRATAGSGKAAGTIPSGKDYLGAVDVTIQSVAGKTVMTGAADATAFTLGGTTDNYTLTNGSGQTLKATSGTALSFNTTGTPTWKIADGTSSAIEITNTGYTNSTIYYNSSASPSRFKNYTSGAQSPVYLYVCGSGGPFTYDLTPCGPVIKGTNNIKVTSVNGAWVRSITDIAITGERLPSNVTIKARVLSGNFKLREPAISSIGSTEIILATNYTNATYNGTLALLYTPTAAGETSDGKIELRVYTTGGNIEHAKCTLTVQGHALPEKFVIAANTGSGWVALPNDKGATLETAGTNTAYPITVDNNGDPTKATLAPSSTVYAGTGRASTYAYSSQSGVRFTYGGKYLEGSLAADTKLCLSPNHSEHAQSWYLESDNFKDYNAYLGARTNANRHLAYDATNKAIANYAAEGTVRFLPIDEECRYFPAPKVTIAQKKTTEVTLTFDALAGATGYQISTDNANWSDATYTVDKGIITLTINGLYANTDYTYYVRGIDSGSMLTNCAESARIDFHTANCDNPPTIGGTIAGNSSCGTLTLTATEVSASSDGCPITQYGFQYTQDPTTWATYEQTEHIDVPGSEFSNEVTVSRGGKYYVRLYAVNEVGTGYSDVKTITVSGLANLQIITAGDATTAPMISGKATLRIGAVSDSPSPITWQVFDGSNAQQTAIADGITNNGVFSTTAFGVYRVVAKQAANSTYCADSATIYIEVRLPNHYGYVTNCAVLNNNNLEVINVSKDNITFGIDDADVVQIEIVKENTGNTSTGGGGQANDLFISKYFEATSNVKLLALYNGTNNDINLSDYTIKLSNEKNTILNGEPPYDITISLSSILSKLPAGQELILITYQNSKNGTDMTNPDGTTSKVNSSDYNILKCAASNPEQSGWASYVRIPELNFSGNDAVALFKGSALIDIIGAGNAYNANLGPSETVGVIAARDFMDAPGWYNANGFLIQADGSIGTTQNYALSTNRCLLIRRNTVKDGSQAVAKNTSDFVTLGGEYGEWMGYQIPDENAGCDGFMFVGGFDYAEYFQRYEPVTGKIDLVPLNQNADGSWSLSTTSFEGTAWEDKNFHDLACTSVKINGYKKIGSKDSLITALNYKVPIIVDRTTTTDDDDLFGFAGDGRIICPECDVVIRDNKKLSVVPAGYNNIRNMWVYSGAALNIQDDKTYNMGKLTIESENNEVGYALIKGTLNAQDGISHTKRIDANAWYDFSLPYNCKVSDIVRTNGKTLGTYGTDWIIKYYDGQKRANTGTPNGATPTNWAAVPADGILEAGVGYIVALGGTHNANPNYKVRFVLPNRSTQPYVESVTSSVKKGVKGYTGPKAEELPCHKGWNYLGNPYVSRFDGNRQTPSWQKYTGLLLNGYYTDLLTGNSYDVIEYPDIYVAVDMGEGGVTNWVQTKASEAQLSPFRAFMIQAVSDGDVDFNKEARNLPQGQAPSVRSVNTERETVSAVRLNIDHDTYGTGSTDIMLHSLYTDKYDLGYDMVRMFNSRPAAQPFTLNSTADYLLYNAANRDLAEASDIPVGIRTLAAGTYTFSLAPLTGTDRYAAIYLIDRDENDLKIDLLQGNYTTMLARETNTSRFALRFEKRAQLPTDIDNDAIQSPIIYRDQTDIVIDNLPTDATVRVVDAIGRTLYMQQADAQIVRFHAPARGAYIIQVMTQQGNFSIKTIL